MKIGGDNEQLLSIKFPKIAKEWDYANNGELTPNDVTYGSKKKVFWICSKCGESYPCTISNRTLGKGCPYCCHNPKVNSKNNLAVLRPHLAKEWDYIKNSKKPEDVLPNSNKSYNWICPKGHKYPATANNRSSGHCCPYCAGQKVCKDNCLATKNPDIAKQWHLTKNKKTPTEVTAGANQYAWWICEKGHEWRAKINNRTSLNRGCRECSKGLSTSVPEQIVFFYVNQLFTDAINGYKLNKREIDVYIPSLKIGIEYDGEAYHKSKTHYEKDFAKNRLLSNSQIFLIRIREKKCFPMSEDTNCKIINCEYTSDYGYLNDIIMVLLDFLCKKAEIENKIKVNVSNVLNRILSETQKVVFTKSFAFLHKDIALEWDYASNTPLKPEMFLPMSDKVVGWICGECGGKWNAPIKSRSMGYGCSPCANRYQYSTSEWIQKAREIHSGKFDYSKVNYVNSKTKVIIVCPKHGEFEQVPSEHMSAKGCKYCAGQAFHPLNSLAIVNPEIAAEWDYENNIETPNDVGTYSSKKYYWKCNNGKPHSYEAYIQQRLGQSSKCSVCNGRQMVYETSLAYLRPDLAEEWCLNENKKLPAEVTLGMEDKIWWKCKNPDHEPYPASIYNRAHLNSGCPECSGNIKTHKTYSNEVFQKFPNIVLLSEYKKSSTRVDCKCKECGYEWSPFPYNLLKGKGCPECYKKRGIVSNKKSVSK